MAGKWPVLPLREAGVSLIDCVHNTPPAAASGYPYIAIPQLKQGRLDLSDVRLISREHFIAWTQKALPTQHDIILSRRCNPGETAVVPPRLECALGQNLVILRADGTKVFPPFLRWLVRGPEWWDQIGTFINVGAVFDSLRCADIPNFRLSIPPLSIQERLAHILGSLDDKIELNRKMNETLEAMARALFKSWFIDFDPVRAKADGRKPAGMDDATANLFPDSFEESAIGQIPHGWRVVTLGSVANNVSTTFKFTEGKEVVFINTGDVLEGDFLHSRRSHPTSLPGQAKKSIRPNQILFSEIRPENKRYAFVEFESSDYVVSTKFMVIENSKDIHPRLLYRILTSQETINEFQIQAESRSGTFPQITFDSIKYLPMVLPPIAIQESFESVVASLDSKSKIQKQESGTLAEIRDSLLPKLLSGEIRIKDAERFVEANT